MCSTRNRVNPASCSGRWVLYHATLTPDIMINTVQGCKEVSWKTHTRLADWFNGTREGSLASSAMKFSSPSVRHRSPPFLNRRPCPSVTVTPYLEKGKQ